MKKNIKHDWGPEECIKNELIDDDACCWNVSIIKPFKKNSKGNGFFPRCFFNFLN